MCDKVLIHSVLEVFLTDVLGVLAEVIYDLPRESIKGLEIEFVF
jgi:hypothetical protein